MSWRRMSMRRTSRHGASADSCDQCDVLRSVNGTASKCKTFLATATEECCPARGTLAGHFTRRLSPSPMPGKRMQQQRPYLPLKRSSPRPQFYRAIEWTRPVESVVEQSEKPEDIRGVNEKPFPDCRAEGPCSQKVFLVVQKAGFSELSTRVGVRPPAAGCAILRHNLVGDKLC